jgi:hypothetical protein
MTKDYDNYHAIQFYAENEQELQQLELLKSQVRKQEIMLNRMLMPFEVQNLYALATTKNEL